MMDDSVKVYHSHEAEGSANKLYNCEPHTRKEGRGREGGRGGIVLTLTRM